MAQVQLQNYEKSSFELKLPKTFQEGQLKNLAVKLTHNGVKEINHCGETYKISCTMKKGRIMCKNTLGIIITMIGHEITEAA